MIRIVALIVVTATAGCIPEPTPNAVDGTDLKWAYDRCVGYEDDDFDKRLACTSAVYGGMIWK